MFSRKGEIRILATAIDEEALIDAALDAGADDVLNDGDTYVVFTAPEKLFAVGDALRARDLEPASQKLVQVPLNTVAVPDHSTASQVIHLYEALDDLDDVQNVYANFDIPDEVLEHANVQA
jgi:transcriptional/translational regulatory protein YebC/TACO1